MVIPYDADIPVGTNVVQVLYDIKLIRVGKWFNPNLNP